MTEQEWTRLIQGLTSTGGVDNPNAKQNLADYGTATGLDPTQRYGGYNAARFLMPAQFNLDAGQLAFANVLQPEAHAAIMDLITMLQNPTAMSAQYRDQVMAQVQQHLPELYSQLSSSGLGIGAKEGLALAAHNQGETAANAYDANLYSPEGLSGRGEAIAGLATSQNPTYSGLSTLHGIEVGTPRNQTGLQAAGSLFGSALSGGIFNNVFNGGSSGSGSGGGSGGSGGS